MVGLVITGFKVVCFEGQRKITRYFVFRADNLIRKLPNMWNSYAMSTASLMLHHRREPYVDLNVIVSKSLESIFNVRREPMSPYKRFREIRRTFIPYDRLSKS
jgi:hypothetical protein